LLREGRLNYLETQDWCFSKEGAEKIKEEMRVKKIASLRKQLAKLESMCGESPSAEADGF
jgi:hypothetical protein